MKAARLLVAGLTMLAVATGMPRAARAQTYSFTFGGAGVGGSLVLTYGAVRDAKYSGAYEITGIRGTFSDANGGLNIVNASVGSLVAIARAAPDTSNHLAPNDFSRFAVASGNSEGGLSYDNLFWPGGSPQTASDYPLHGGFLDIYGVLFSIGGGRVVNVWSNGDAGSGIDYGVAVTTSSMAMDYVPGGVTVSATPEPGSLWLLGVGGVGLVGVLTRRRPAAGVQTLR